MSISKKPHGEALIMIRIFWCGRRTSQSLLASMAIHETCGWRLADVTTAARAVPLWRSNTFVAEPLRTSITNTYRCASVCLEGSSTINHASLACTTEGITNRKITSNRSRDDPKKFNTPLIMTRIIHATIISMFGREPIPNQQHFDFFDATTHRRACAYPRGSACRGHFQRGTVVASVERRCSAGSRRSRQLLGTNSRTGRWWGPMYVPLHRHQRSWDVRSTHTREIDKKRNKYAV